MKSAREIREQYQMANTLAVKSQKKNDKQVLPVCPASQNDLVDDRLVSYQQNLGVLEIPVNLIVGVAETSEQSLLYTNEFLPIPEPGGQFADIWRSICEAYLDSEETPGEISCLEYLGRFYVVDGLKRVSVKKYFGASTIKARVVRIMPVRTNTKEVQRYYDFLFQYRFTQLYQLQFTRSAFFEQFQAALGNSPSYRWSDADRSRFLMHWNTIEEAFRKSYGESLNITTADALVVLLRKYPYEKIIQMESWVLARIFQASWKELYTLSFPDVSSVGSMQAVSKLHTA